MARKRSVFEYNAIPFNKVELTAGPVVQIMEMNDGYQIVLTGKDCEKIGESSTAGQRGGIEVYTHDTFRDYLAEEFGADVGEDGTVTFDGDETAEELLERLSKDGDPIMGGGLLQVSELRGSYTNPESLFMSFFDGDDDEDGDED